MPLSPRFIAILTLLPVVAACADTGYRFEAWNNANLEPDFQALDKNSCAQHADKLAGLQLQRDLGAPSNSGQTGGQITQGFARTDARRLKARLFEHCMRERGYRKVGD